MTLRFHMAALAATAALAGPAFAGRHTRTTQEVFDHHNAALAAGDIEEILKDYTADSVIMGPDGPLTGPDEMRPLFRFFLDEFGKPGAAFTVDRALVHDDMVMTIWNADLEGMTIPFGTDTFLIREGRIVRQTFAFMATPK